MTLRFLITFWGIILCMLNPFDVQSQTKLEHLHLQNSFSRKSKVIKKGREIRVGTSSDSIVRGYLKGVGSDHIYIGDDSIHLSTIDYVAIDPRGAEIVGLVLLGTGTASILLGVYTTLFAFTRNNLQGFFVNLLTGAGYVMIGATLHAIALVSFHHTRHYLFYGKGAWSVVNH